MLETVMPGDELELAIESFLRVSGAYLLSCAYRESLRAAYARRAAEDPLVEQEMRYRELVALEAVKLVRAEWHEQASVLATRKSPPPAVTEM
jgi:hypothetical protein